jgi:hypothetical protein
MMYLPLQLPEGERQSSYPRDRMTSQCTPIRRARFNLNMDHTTAALGPYQSCDSVLLIFQVTRSSSASSKNKTITPVADTSCARHRCRACGMGYLSRRFRDKHYQQFRDVRDLHGAQRGVDSKTQSKSYLCTFCAKNQHGLLLCTRRCCRDVPGAIWRSD